jgi:hypothetical protein
MERYISLITSFISTGQKEPSIRRKTLSSPIRLPLSPLRLDWRDVFSGTAAQFNCCA